MSETNPSDSGSNTQGRVVIEVLVRPRSGRRAVRGRRADGVIEVCVKSAPEGGKANAEVALVIARALGVAASAVTILRGGTSRRKVMRIEGVSSKAVDAWLLTLTAP